MIEAALASATGLLDPGPSLERGTASKLVITSSAGAALTALSLSAETATSGTADNIYVSAENQYGIFVPSLVGSVSVASSDKTATMPTAATYTSGTSLDNGIHEFAVTLALVKKTKTTVTFSDKTDKLASATASITVSPGAASKLDYGGGQQILKELREILARSPRVTCLFAGSAEHLMRDLFTNRQRALYGFGGFHDLSPITTHEWHDGLSARFAEDRVQADPDALERIVAAGRTHPRCTMLIAQQAHVAIVEEDSRRLDLTGAERGYLGAMAAERARHADGLLDARRLRPGALRVLTNLAHRTPTYRQIEPKTARRALDALAAAGIVSRGTGRGEWAITDPLCADYLATVLPHP